MTTQLKFGRNYLLTAQSKKFKNFSIGSPFTIDFDITRTSYPDCNHAIIRLYNLSAYHRNLLVYDQWNQGDVSQQISITLFAGYGPGVSTVNSAGEATSVWPIAFKGNTQRAYSYRDGIDFITVLDCFDGGTAFWNAVTDTPFSAGESMATVYASLVNDLLPFGVSAGFISQQLSTGVLAKGASFSGNTIDILKQLSNSNFFIDNGAANLIVPQDAIGGTQVVINAGSGLLGTPIKEQDLLRFKILFEPRIVIGTIVNLQSLTSIKQYNGPHKVMSIHHQGMISAAVCGEATTELTVAGGVFTADLQRVGAVP